MEPVHRGAVPLVDPHQHGGGLLPGGGVGGEELELSVGAGDALDHADIVGNGDVARVALHIVKGEGQGGQILGQGVVPQGPHQHHRHLLPADEVQGPEGAVGVHHVVGPGGLHGGVVPLPGAAVYVGGGGRGDHVPVKHPAQDGDKFRPGDVVADAEPAVGVALHQAVIPGLVNVGLGPVAAGIGKSPGGGGEGCGAKQ